MNNSNQPVYTPNKDLLDHFTKEKERRTIAAMCLQGLIANGNYELTNTCQQYAEDAVKLADALLKELDKQPTP